LIAKANLLEQQRLQIVYRHLQSLKIVDLSNIVNELIIDKV